MKNDGTQPIFTLKDDLEAAEDSAAPCVAEKTEKEASEASVSTRLKNLFAARKKSSSNEENRENELSETEEASADEPRLPDDGDGKEKRKTASRKKKRRKTPDLSLAQRYCPRADEGLTSEQVESRKEDGYVNELSRKQGKSVLQIFLGNIFTFFNMLYLVIAVILMVYAQWTQITFLIVAVVNTGIAIFQEIKSKKSLDKLRIVAAPAVKVVRDGKETEISVEEIVLDDVMKLETGVQICADAVVLEGQTEVNESMLTGESESVVKKKGDNLFAGSYVVSGACLARADKIAEANYIEGLTSRARKYKKPRSQLLGGLKIILKVVAVIIILMIYFMWQTNYTTFLASGLNSDEAFIRALTNTAGSVIGMIPAGPFLLTSMTLAVSVIRLSKRKTMVQELYCIEMLARVDTICLDKTGTLTDGTMRVVETIDFNSGSRYTLKEIMGSVLKAQNDKNMTSKALKKHFGAKSVLKHTAIVPFSSSRKLSAVSFEKEGTFFLGAPEFVLNAKNQRVDSLVRKYAEKGFRVLLLAQSSSVIYAKKDEEIKLPVVRRPIALIVIEDHIRDDAVKTINWFKENGVGAKIISGDNPLTVSHIAAKVGVENAENYISLEGLDEKTVAEIAMKYTVFGRVSPEQKAVLVKAIKKAGHTVAMTGDGVNDILALRESDCAIALAGGSQAACNAAHLVLLDDNFASLPQVVAEGRQVVNNIQAATSMYFMKTIYTIVLNLLIVIANYGFGQKVAYPFTSSQVMLLEMIIVGLPTTILALQKNNDIIRGRFLVNVAKRSFPASLTFLVVTVSLYVVFLSTQSSGWLSVSIGLDEFSTIAVLALTFGSYFALYYACKPLNWWKSLMLAGVLVLVLLGIFALPWFFGYVRLNGVEILLLVSSVLISFPLLKFNMWLVAKIVNAAGGFVRRLRRKGETA